MIGKFSVEDFVVSPSVIAAEVAGVLELKENVKGRLA